MAQARAKKAKAKTSTDHDVIRRWAETRGGTPSAVKGTGRGKRDPGMIRIDFPGYSGEGKLQPISWDEWFEKFDDSNLALIFQEKTARGQRSNFNKLISRDTIEGDGGGKGSRRKTAARGTSTGRTSRTSERPAKRTSAQRTSARKNRAQRTTRGRSTSTTGRK